VILQGARGRLRSPVQDLRQRLLASCCAAPASETGSTRSEARVVAVLRLFCRRSHWRTARPADARAACIRRLCCAQLRLLSGRDTVSGGCAVGDMAVAGAALAAFALASVAASAVSVNNNRTTLYDLTAVALDGSRVSLASLRGNVSLVINDATF
jgi:hypothetical protein